MVETAMKRVPMVVLLGVALALGAILFTTRRREIETPVESRPFVWEVEVDQLERIEIALPGENAFQRWIKRDDKYWYFDEPDGPRVDLTRWGGGVPLLASGPAAERIVVESATGEALLRYGLSEPTMILRVTVAGDKTIEAHVGATTPDGRNHYVRLSDGSEIYAVDHSWYDALSQLALDPPYPD